MLIRGDEANDYLHGIATLVPLNARKYLYEARSPVLPRRIVLRKN